MRLFTVFSALGLFASSVSAYDNSRNDNLIAYYGQNSYGVTHSDQAGWQQRLSYYCQDDTINGFPIAFLHVFFSTGGLPEINLANTCSSNSGVFPGTSLANCQFLQEDIKGCQAKGKIVTLSLGGATGGATFSSDAQAEQFADTVWNLFLGGSSSTRPFGNAVLDGVDLDIEGGSSTGYAAFVKRIQSKGGSKKYYITAAPQCPYPDAWLGPALNSASFDAVYVQFYNNYCGVNSPSQFNFGQWDTWAKTVSPNKNVKVFIGAPAAPSAANSGSYVDANALASLIKTGKGYSSFGGVMLWDVSQAYGNNRFDKAVKNALTGTTGGDPPPTGGDPPPTGGCSSAPAWSSSVAYTGGQQVKYNGRLWTAKWWTQAEVPGGSSGVWTDSGACFAKVESEAATSAEAPASTSVSASVSASASESAPTSAASDVQSASATESTASATASSSTTSETADVDARALKASRFFKVEF